jgi:secreted trypsin-like serine protease
VSIDPVRRKNAAAREKMPSIPRKRRRIRTSVALALVSTATLLSSAAAVSPGATAQARTPPAHAAIIGGSSVAPGALASVAEILDLKGGEIGQCTGTVIAPSLVLTAGHCVENIETAREDRPSGYRVLTGAVSHAGANAQVSMVSQVIVYEGFARKDDDGDAALLVLSAPTSAPAMKLATAADAAALRPGATDTLAGWGETRFGQNAPSEALRSATTVVQTTRWCAHNAPPFFAGGEICTIDAPSYATGACFGDSGGPLFTDGGEGEPVELGIAVHVYKSCSTRRPTVFTSVVVLARWIQSWVAAYAPAASPAPTAN